MAKYEWSEIFMSIEGEGPMSGHPTAYIRFSRCNFTCGKFNNPDNNVDSKGYATLDFNPSDVKSLGELQPIEVGCDTQYAVNPEFKHIWTTGNEDELAQAVVDVLPHKSWINPNTGKRNILSLTGGEPTLMWKKIPVLLNHPLMDELETLLIETNCAVPFKDATTSNFEGTLINELEIWINDGIERNINRQVIWSNSPKLSASGEKRSEAIRPEIAVRQLGIGKYVHVEPGHVQQYFKFVCGPREKDFNEVALAMEAYYAAEIPQPAEVLIMPESCTESQQISIAAEVADMCIQRGYVYCHRIHNSVYANAIGK